jgi:hypothetical protein
MLDTAGMLVSDNDLSIYMDISFSMRQKDAAEFVLKGLQMELEAYLGRPVRPQVFTESHVIPSSYVGIPATSFFYDSSLNSTGESLNYLMPAINISLRNTPVSQVTEVRFRNIAEPYQLMGEAVTRSCEITDAEQNSTSATYTSAGHSLTVGQTVSIKNTTPSTYNLSNKQIVSITSNTFTVAEVVGSLGTYVSGGTATATGNDYVVHRYGLELFRGFANDIVDVTYRGGLEGDIQEMFKLMILRAATREMQNMHDDVVGIKDLNSRNVAPLETGFLEKELMAMKRYRRRRI